MWRVDCMFSWIKKKKIQRTNSGSEEFNFILVSIKNGDNIFVTDGAGVERSHTLFNRQYREKINYLEDSVK